MSHRDCRAWQNWRNFRLQFLDPLFTQISFSTPRELTISQAGNAYNAYNAIADWDTLSEHSFPSFQQVLLRPCCPLFTCLGFHPFCPLFLFSCVVNFGSVIDANILLQYSKSHFSSPAAMSEATEIPNVPLPHGLSASPHAPDF